MTPRHERRDPALRHQRHDPALRPFIVIWESTRACPLACVHCRAEARPHRDPRELTTAEGVELMRQVADFGSPPPLFVITGGDPFSRPDLPDLVRAGSQLGLAVAVSPSGTPALTEANLRLLHEAGTRAISLSIDGSTAQIHDEFRGVPGTFAATLAAWETSQRLGMRVQVNTTVTPHNIADLPAIAAMVHDRRAMTWSAFFLVPTGRGRALGALSAAEVEDILNLLYDLGTLVPVKTTELHHFRRVVLQRRVLADRGLDHVAVLGLGPLYLQLRQQALELGLPIDQPERTRRPPLDVNAGRGFVFISHVGSVHPSGFLPAPAGNVREAPLADIYRDSSLFRSLRDPAQLHGRCGQCEFAAVCGGSRSRAYGITGDVLAEEPWCAYQPGSFSYPVPELQPPKAS